MNKEQLISKGKELILDDMAKKVIPMNVQSFEDLHKYVDANGYISNNFECFDISQIGMFNEVIEELSGWINGEYHANCRNLMDNIIELIEVLLPLEKEACEFMLGDHPMLNLSRFISDEIKTFDGLLDGDN